MSIFDDVKAITSLGQIDAKAVGLFFHEMVDDQLILIDMLYSMFCSC